MRTLRIPGPGESAMAQIVAHELNNIAASMLGFLEIGATHASRDSALRNSLGELRIGVDRMINLAGVLQRFGETEGCPTVVALADCLPEARSSGASGGVRIDWRGDAAGSVFADPARVRSALEILVDLASSKHVSNGAPVLRIELSETAPMHCKACGRAVGARHVRVSLRNEVPRTHGKSRTARDGRPSLEAMMLDACTHLAHLGGAHAVLGDRDECFALLIATGPPGPNADASQPHRGNPQRRSGKPQGIHPKTEN